MRNRQGKVLVRVETSGDTAIKYGVPVQFRPTLEDPESGRRTDQSRPRITVIAPISVDPRDSASARLKVGDYDVEATLPSGETLIDEITIKPNEEHDIILRGIAKLDRPDFTFTGFSSRSLRSLDFGKHLSYRPSSPDLTVTIGVVAESQSANIPQSFNPASWDDWYDYFLDRYENREKNVNSTISLSGDSLGLSVITEGTVFSSSQRIKISQESRPYIDRTAIGGKRLCASITGEFGSRIISLPWPWDWNHSERALFEIIVQQDKNQLKFTPNLIDGRWGSLLSYMNSGRIHLAAEILKQAEEALFEKMENPLAAAMGGYILMSTQEGEDSDDWPRWLNNLAERFPNLPDGAILRARWLVRKGGRENIAEAHELIYESISRGIPFFTTGVIWLVDCLEQTSIDCPICIEMLKKIRGVARSMDLSQAFTSFTIIQKRGHGSSYTPEGYKPNSSIALKISSNTTQFLSRQEVFTDLNIKHPLVLPLLRN